MVWKKIIPPVFAACIFPYVVTLGWTGRISSQDSGFHGKQLKNGEIGNLPDDGDGAEKRKIILDRDTETVLDAEESVQKTAALSGSSAVTMMISA